jgi:hypothetical protein
LAILPVSNEISLPAISTETRVTALLLIVTTFLLHPSVGGAVFFLPLYPNAVSLADAESLVAAKAVDLLAPDLANPVERPDTGVKS